MAETRNFTINSTGWTLLASGRSESQAVRVQGGAPFTLAVTVGAADVRPSLPPATGHRVSTSIDFPLVSRQHLWASAAAPTSITVT